MSTRTAFTTTGLVAALAFALAGPGCHRPQGAMMSYSGGSHTFWSTETTPKTVVVKDVRSGESVFTMDVPAGKQLSLDFLEGEGDDPVYSPDLMRYEIFDIGTETGKLRNAMSVPAAPSRRIEVSLRQGPEYRATAPDQVLRTDQLEDRPDWWSPEGGPMPEDLKGMANYDQ